MITLLQASLWLLLVVLCIVRDIQKHGGDL